MPFHLELLWGATSMLLRGCVIDWDGTIVRVCKNSTPVLSHLWTEVHEILGQCTPRRLVVLSKALA